MPRALLIVALVAAAAPAQVFPARVIVASRVTGATQTQLIEVLTASGAVTPLGGFSFDDLPPTAVAVDRVNGDVVVAQQGIGFSRVIRVRLSGLTVANEWLLGTIAGTITDVEFGPDGAIYVSTDGPGGGISRFPRNGGPSAQILTMPDVSAFDVPWAGPQGILARPVPNSDPEMSFFDLTTGGVTGTWPVAGMGMVRPTGVVDLPTGAIRQALTDDQGGLWRFEFLSTATPWGVTPPLVPGATAEIKMNGTDILILGGAASPFIRQAQIFGLTLTNVAGPIPGDPVDMAFGDLPVARVVRFGNPCTSTWASAGAPTIGNTAFQLGISNGVPLAVASLVLGLDDQFWNATPLPLALPGGCELLVSVDLVLPTVTNGVGVANLVVPVPADPALAGTIVYGQWGQIDATGAWVTSDALAAHIW